MKNTYTLPTQTLEFFDVSVLTARLHMLVTLTMALLDIEWMDERGVIKNKRLQRRCMSRAGKIASRVRRVVAAILKIETHNALLEMKLDMLGTPKWRARVLKDLGGMSRLRLWDAAWLRYVAGDVAGDVPKAPKPVKPEPVWWRSPERVAESERLKARFRLCEKACVNPRTLKDPFKVDFEGDFRLAPIPRDSYAKGKPRIYSKIDICEYGYDAMPIWKDFGIGVSCVYPMEFYAAMMLEREDVENYTPIVIPHEGIVRRCGTQPQEPEFEVRPRICAHTGLVRDDILKLNNASNDNHALIEFIGRKNYKYIFENPG